MRYAQLMLLFLLSAFIGCSTTKYSVDETYYWAKKAYEKKDYAKAELYYQQFLEENPDGPLNEITLYYLANSKQQLGHVEEARALYQKLIDTYQAGFWVDLSRQDLEDINAAAAPSPAN